MSAREKLHARLFQFAGENRVEMLDAFKAEIQREDAATVRAQAPKYLDNEADQAIFYALDLAANEIIHPDKD